MRVCVLECRSHVATDAILDGETVIARPHKVYGPENNDLILPLHPAAQVLGWLFECERTQISHSFALLKASTRVVGASPTVITSIDAWALGASIAGFAEYAVFFLFF